MKKRYLMWRLRRIDARCRRYMNVNPLRYNKAALEWNARRGALIDTYGYVPLSKCLVHRAYGGSSVRKLGISTIIGGIVMALFGVGLYAVTVTNSPEAQSASVVITAAGDICANSSSGSAASCQGTADEVTAANPVKALTLGDNQYPNGELAKFQNIYNDAWGAFKSDTAPSAGNHDWNTANAQGYKDYFGDLATPVGSLTYYSYDVGDWHLVALDSNIAHGSASAQVAWLEDDLAASTDLCTLAYWHHPRYSSGTNHGSDASVEPFWDALEADGAEIVLNGHEHHYEKFALHRGMREFVVGTGGVGAGYPFGDPLPNQTGDPTSQFRLGDVKGIAKLVLNATDWSMQFLDTDGDQRSSASGTCHT